MQNAPENDNEAVKHVVNAADVTERTFSDNLHRHFDDKQATE